jgi:hypothetical protein
MRQSHRSLDRMPLTISEETGSDTNRVNFVGCITTITWAAGIITQ